MTDFSRLIAELDQWSEAGRIAEFWWRDDDATAATPEIRTLLNISAEHAVPAVLAVIPFGAKAELAELTARHPLVRIWQHGVRHYNAALPSAKKRELGPPSTTMLHNLKAGQSRLSQLFGAQFAAVLVPPWNRIDPALTSALPGLGFDGISTFKPRTTTMPAPGLPQINAHVDILNWRAGAAFRAGEECVNEIASHLQAKRAEAVDPREPTGLLTHHKAMGNAAWDFIRALFVATNSHPACRWTSPIFNPPETDIS